MANSLTNFAARRLRYGINALRFRGDIDAVMRTMNAVPFDQFVAEHGTRFNAKYLNADFWVRRCFERVFLLGLHRSRPLNILDIGTGCGYFPFICNYYGHTAIGTDLGGDPLYTDVLEHLDVPLIPWFIKPFEAGPTFDRRFDLITAFMVAFNRPLSTPWSPEEWQFLLRDLAENHLVDDGRIYLLLNSESNGRPYGDELLSFFRSRGAKVVGSRIEFPSRRLLLA